MTHNKKVLWDNVIPDKIVIPGRSPQRRDPQGEDLILQRVPGANYALYKVDYKRSRLFPEKPGATSIEARKK